ncbi:unnamed protein product [Malus baccata var. baccata]
MENILPLSIFLVNLAPSSRIFNQAGPKSNPLPHSESQSSTSRKSTRLAVIFALSFTAVATLRLCSVWCATLEGTGLSDKDIAALSGGHTLILLQIQTNIVLMVRGLKNLCGLITHALCKN